MPIRSHSHKAVKKSKKRSHGISRIAKKIKVREADKNINN
jgi:hypothetical protein